MREGLDLSDLEAYLSWMANYPKDVKKVKRMQMQKAGNELKRRVKQQARASGIKLQQTRVSGKKRNAIDYLSSIKRGKIVFDKNDDASVRVYSNAPHSHLLEEGHRVYHHKQPTGTRTRAFQVFAKANADFAGDFERIVNRMIRDIQSAFLD